jgi:hypothetical protein
MIKNVIGTVLALEKFFFARSQNTFSEWRIFSCYTLRECEKTFNVTHRTVNNWESGRIQPPRAVIICLGLFGGRLDHLGKNWRGFRITPECIESPNGDFVRCGEIRALRYAMQSMEINRLRRCRLNENELGEIEPLNVDKKPFNVTCIDRKIRPKGSNLVPNQNSAQEDLDKKSA